MVRLAFTTLAMHVVAEDSLMQFEKASDFDTVRAHGASHTTRMQQTAQAMADQWKGFLMNVAKSGSWKDPATGNPWIPDKEDMLEPVKVVIEQMEDELDGQKDLNTWIMGNHTQAIEACATARNNALNNAVSTALNTMTAARSTHSTCRGTEETEIGDMEQKCQLFEATNRCEGREQDWFAAYDEGTTGADSLSDVVDKAVNCKGAVDTLTTTADTCDANQKTFTAAWCDYHDVLESTCNTYNQCWEGRTGDWDQASASIQTLENEQKTIFRMLGRIRCYLDLLFQKAGDTAGGVYGLPVPTTDDIEGCQNVARIDDSTLNVTYGQKEAHSSCEGHPTVNGEKTGYAWPASTATAYGPHQGGTEDGKTWYVKEITDLGDSHGQMTLDADLTCEKARLA